MLPPCSVAYAQPSLPEVSSTYRTWSTDCNFFCFCYLYCNRILQLLPPHRASVSCCWEWLHNENGTVITQVLHSVSHAQRWKCVSLLNGRLGRARGLLLLGASGGDNCAQGLPCPAMRTCTYEWIIDINTRERANTMAMQYTWHAK